MKCNTNNVSPIAKNRKFIFLYFSRNEDHDAAFPGEHFLLKWFLRAQRHASFLKFLSKSSLFFPTAAKFALSLQNMSARLNLLQHVIYCPFMNQFGARLVSIIYNLLMHRKTFVLELLYPNILTAFVSQEIV